MDGSPVYFQQVPPSQWPDPSSAKSCQLNSCHKGFGLMGKRANCNGCGKVCCSACLSQALVLPGFVTEPPKALCPFCAAAVMQAWEQQEASALRAKLLTNIVEDQVQQMDTLVEKSNILRKENEALLQSLQDKDSDMLTLKATLTSLQVEYTQLQQKYSSLEQQQSNGGSSSSAALRRTSSTVGSPSGTATAAASSPSGDLQDDSPVLQRKKTLLDMKEASLAESRKKLTADNEKLRKERERLQQLEEYLTKQLEQDADGILQQLLLDVKVVHQQMIAEQKAELLILLQQKISTPSAQPQHTTQTESAQEAAKHASEVAELKASIAALEAASKDSSSAVTDLQKQHASALEAERAKHASAVAELKAAIVVLESANASLGHSDEITLLNDEIVSLKARLGKLKGDLAASVEETKKIQEENRSLKESAKGEVAKMMEMLSTVRGENADLKTKLKAQSGTGTLREKNSVLEADVKRLKTLLEGALEEQSKLRAKLKNSEKAAAVTRTELYRMSASPARGELPSAPQPVALRSASPLARKPSVSGPTTLVSSSDKAGIQEATLVHGNICMAYASVVASSFMEFVLERCRLWLQGLGEESAKRRLLSRKNTEALEKTTEVLRAAQQDMKVRSQRLDKREADLEELHQVKQDELNKQLLRLEAQQKELQERENEVVVSKKKLSLMAKHLQLVALKLKERDSEQSASTGDRTKSAPRSSPSPTQQSA